MIQLARSDIQVEVDVPEAKAYVTFTGEGDYPSFEEVVDALKAHDVSYWIDEVAIKQALAQGVFHERTPVAFARDGTAQIVVEKGEKEAYMILRPPCGGRDMTADDIESVLADNWVVFGIDSQAIEKAVAEKTYTTRILVARFSEPVHGIDAVIEPLFTTDLKIAPKEMEGQKVDYRELESVVSVRKDTVLARKTPATKGENGFTVTGKPLYPVPGKDMKLVAGKNARLSPDGLEVIANGDGQPVLRERTISVEPVLLIDGDLDYCTGNINFVGSVRISGNVISGFTLKATEHIQIDGLVEDSFIEAGGDVLIKGGIQGKQKGTIRAAGNVSARFVEQASVEAGGTIMTGEALHSNLLAGDQVTVITGKGHICGGRIGARNVIHAKFIGADSGVRTELAVGFQPKEKALLEKLTKERADRKSALEQLGKDIATVEQYQLDGARWAAQHEAAYKRLVMGREALKERIEALDAEIGVVEEALGKAETPEIKAVNTIYPNVQIRIKDLVFENEGELTTTVFHEEEGEIHAKAYVF